MIVHQIVDRLHVGCSNLHVLRQVRKKMTPGFRTATDRVWRARRKLVYRAALERHRANRELFSYAMGSVS